MNLTLIGTGNVGTHLLTALQKAGHTVTQLHGRQFSPTDVRGEIAVVSVKDDALPLIAEKLAQFDGLVVHTAGSVPMEVFKNKRRGVLYPMQTFSKEREVDFSQVSLFIESDSDLALLRTLAESLSPHVYELDSEGRKRLHLAAVFACNFCNHCYTLCDELLREQGLPFSVMLPLIDETTRKVHTVPPREAQTGPAIRRDQSTMKKHEEMLSGRMQAIYRLLSESIMNETK